MSKLLRRPGGPGTLDFCCMCKKFLPKSAMVHHMKMHAADKLAKTPGTSRNVSEKPKEMGKDKEKEEKHYSRTVHEEKFPKTLSEEHSMLNASKQTFHCSVCEEIFSTRISLQSHMIRHVDVTHCSASVSVKPQPEVKQKSYVVCVCGQTFLHGDDIRRHMRSHVNKYKIQHPCPFCKNSFPTKKALQKHKASHSLKHQKKVNEYSCDVCEEKFPKKSVLNQHMKLHISKQTISCNICNKVLSTNWTLKVHMLSHTGERPFSCSICKKAFHQKSTLNKHQLVHTDRRIYSCSICGKGVYGDNNLKRHLESHSSVKPYRCWICNKYYKTTDSRAVCVKLHSMPKPYSCSYCGKAFIDSLHLKAHERVHTGERPFQCRFCEKRFMLVNCRTSHEKKIHTGMNMVKVHSCSVCGERFCRPHLVKMHMIKHKGEKRFSCSVCEKGFTERWQLVRHEQKAHNDKPPFSCMFCSNYYATECELSEHMQQHSDKITKPEKIKTEPKVQEIQIEQKWHDCSVCGESFSMKHLLKNHMIEHKGEKPFSCSLCSRAFCKQWKLKMHEKTHDGKPQFSCMFCSSSFAKKCLLTKHTQLHHDTENRLIQQEDICDDTACLPAEHLRLHSNKESSSKVFKKKFPKIRAMKALKCPKASSNIDAKGHCNKSYGTMTSFRVPGMTCNICGTSKELYATDQDTDVVLCGQCVRTSVSCSLCNISVQFITLRAHLGRHTAELTFGPYPHVSYLHPV